MATQSFDGMKVFSATMARQRDELGDEVTRWIKKHAQYEIVDKVVTQSSDAEYHCYTVTLFYKDRAIGRG